jgi:CRP-like cAMP-binding protein
MVDDRSKPIENRATKAILDFRLDIPMFDKLDTEELNMVSRHMNFVDFEPGEIIFREGDKGDYVCFLAEGSLDVVKKSERGHYVSLETLSKGRSIGEMAVIDLDSPCHTCPSVG